HADQGIVAPRNGPRGKGGDVIERHADGAAGNGDDLGHVWCSFAVRSASLRVPCPRRRTPPPGQGEGSPGIARKGHCAAAATLGFFTQRRICVPTATSSPSWLRTSIEDFDWRLTSSISAIV